MLSLNILIVIFSLLQLKYDNLHQVLLFYIFERTL